MDGGSLHCIGDRDQDHLQEKEMQKSEMAVWGGFTNNCEKRRREKQRRKGKIYPFECRVMESQRVGHDWVTELNWTECHSKLKRLNYLSCAQSLSHRLFATPWTITWKAPLSMRFPRQEYWSGLPFSPSDLSDPGIKPESLVYPALAGGFFTTSAIWEAQIKLRKQQKTVRS